MNENDKRKMQEYLYEGMSEILKEAKEINKMPAEKAMPFVVDRVVAYVAKKSGMLQKDLKYIMLFDHIFMEYLNMKKILKKEARENAKKEK